MPEMTIILFDDSARDSLLPLTFTRPVAALRIGILTVAEKWSKRFGAETAWLTAPYLQEKFPYKLSSDNIFINGSVCPDDPLIEAVSALQYGEALILKDVLIAARMNETEGRNFNLKEKDPGIRLISYSRPVTRIIYPEDIFLNNGGEIEKDFALITKNRVSAPISSTNTILGDNIFAEEGAVAECSIFNTRQGPVYLGRNSEVWEGCAIRGPFALCSDSQVKMGAKIYSKVTVGPYCRVGGEINNAVIQGYSSKGHEGYLGNSVVGEWCNIGADSNNSNLKNNYAEVRLWDYNGKRMRNTGLQFCGLIMGDHSKCGINTMFNTGTVAGVFANIYGGGFPPNFIPDFSWGGAAGMETYRFEKALETVEKVYARRNKIFDAVEKQILFEIFELTKQYRTEIINN